MRTKKFRNLWRIDRLGNVLYLLVLSDGKPDFTHIVEQFGWPGAEQEWETKDYVITLERIELGQKWQFRLRANPVHSVKQPSNSQAQELLQRNATQGICPCYREAARTMVADRAAKYGFSLQESSFRVVQQEVKKFQRQRPE